MAREPKQPDPPDDVGLDPGDEGQVATEEKVDAVVPRQYHVLLHNDDYTTMEFVVMVLVTVFHHSNEGAVEIMLNVHQKGVGVAGTYSFEVAETKAEKVMTLAREHEFPLKASVEPV
ncbi:MAG: ATP-dependent Clp protease adaptor ClpS [Deltaproteobacteria bacterium]|nr:ATP-dependent Clp protease adaptor ClpS [Deltaproteobacteria bacterium]